MKNDGAKSTGKGKIMFKKKKKIVKTPPANSVCRNTHAEIHPVHMHYNSNVSLSFQHGLIKPLECHAMLSVEKKYTSLSIASAPCLINTFSASPDSSL